MLLIDGKMCATEPAAISRRQLRGAPRPAGTIACIAYGTDMTEAEPREYGMPAVSQFEDFFY